MRYLFLLSIATIALTTACESDGPQIIGSGVIVSETRTVGSFENVEISGVADVIITQGSNQGISVRSDDNIIGLVETEVIQNTLFIGLENGSYDRITLEVNVSSEVLRELTMSGVNTVEVNDFEELDKLSVTISGVGNVKLTGSANELEINNSGATSFEGFDFTANSCQVEVSGVGSVEVTVVDLLSGTLSGVGNIHYKGSPELNVSISGVGSVINAN